MNHATSQQLDLPTTRRRAQPAPITKREWTCPEIAILRHHYPIGGVQACRALLPQRSEVAIGVKAHREGLGQPLEKPRRRAPYESTDALDAEITRIYREGIKRGQMQRFAEQHRRPAWWIKIRAAKLGVSTPRVRPLDWSKEELDIVEANAHRCSATIARRLRSAGYQRTIVAISVIISRRQFDRTDPNRWSANHLATLFGVDPSVVRRWIERHALPAKRAPGIGTAQIIERAQLKRWLADKAQLIDLRRVDKYWFFDLVFGGTK